MYGFVFLYIFSIKFILHPPFFLSDCYENLTISNDFTINVVRFLGIGWWEEVFCKRDLTGQREFILTHIGLNIQQVYWYDCRSTLTSYTLDFTAGCTSHTLCASSVTQPVSQHYCKLYGSNVPVQDTHTPTCEYLHGSCIIATTICHWLLNGNNLVNYA